VGKSVVCDYIGNSDEISEFVVKVGNLQNGRYAIAHPTLQSCTHHYPTLALRIQGSMGDLQISFGSHSAATISQSNTIPNAQSCTAANPLRMQEGSLSRRRMGKRQETFRAGQRI
jgi:hypothetical protein